MVVRSIYIVRRVHGSLYWLRCYDVPPLSLLVLVLLGPGLLLELGDMVAFLLLWKRGKDT